jgi:hypothetical protein
MSSLMALDEPQTVGNPREVDAYEEIYRRAFARR